MLLESWLCHLCAVWSWANHLTSLSFAVLVCKVQKTYLLLMGFVMFNWATVSKIPPQSLNSARGSYSRLLRSRRRIKEEVGRLDPLLASPKQHGSSRSKQWCGASVKNPPADAGDARNVGLILGAGRAPGERKSNPLQYSGLENPMDRGACGATVHGVAKSQTQPSDWAHTHSGQCKWEKVFCLKTRGPLPWWSSGQEFPCQSLAQEDSTCCRANASPCALTTEAPVPKSPCSTTREARALQPRAAHTPGDYRKPGKHQRPSAAKNKINKYNLKMIGSFERAQLW